jgi:predicted ATP-grasp superfamily ATP-dependent carboligase
VAVAADKWQCFRRFTQEGLPTPETHRMPPSEAVAAAAALGFPLVVKPVDGVGCEAVSFVSDTPSLHRALQLMEPRQCDVLLQRYVAGIHASVSLLIANSGVLPLSLNEQTITIGIPFHYLGGSVPLEHGLKQVALEAARRAASLVPGLKGYVGVDVVLTEDQCQLIEINPRLTTSYVGLRQVININLAEAIWHACSADVLPREIILSGKSSFRKEVLGDIQHA